MCWRLGRFGRRPHAFGVTVRNRPHFPARGWLRGQEWERITRGGIRRGAEPYAVRGTSGVATGLAENRRFLPPDGRSAPGLVAAGHHRTPRLRCHAQRRSPSPAARATGMPPHSAVPDKPGQRTADHDGGRDDPCCRARPRCPRSGYPRRLGAAALHSDRSRGDGATIIADADRLLGRAWNPRRLARGRACSTTRFLDGLAAPAPTATGGEPLPKPVRCNTEKPAICVPDRLREDGSGALLAALTLGELFAWHQSRQHRVTDDFCGDDHLCDVITTGNVVHDIEQDLFEDRPQAAGAGAA
jgi:hypothetical protein